MGTFESMKIMIQISRFDFGEDLPDIAAGELILAEFSNLLDLGLWMDGSDGLNGLSQNLANPFSHTHPLFPGGILKKDESIIISGFDNRYAYLNFFFEEVSRSSSFCFFVSSASSVSGFSSRALIIVCGLKFISAGLNRPFSM